MCQKLLVGIALLLAVSGCVGNRRLEMLSPQEREALKDYRSKRARELRQKPTCIAPGWQREVPEPASEDAGASFKLPETHAGTIVTASGHVVPVVSFELLRLDDTPLGSYGANVGGGYATGRLPLFVALDRKFPKLWGIQCGLFAGYDVDAGEGVFGLHVIGIRW